MVGMTPSRSSPVSGRLPAWAASTSWSAAAQQRLGAADDLLAAGRQGDLALAAVDQRRPQQILELAQPGAQGRLGNQAVVGGATEMPVLGDGNEVAQLAQGRQRTHDLISDGLNRVPGRTHSVAWA